MLLPTRPILCNIKLSLTYDDCSHHLFEKYRAIMKCAMQTGTVIPSDTLLSQSTSIRKHWMVHTHRDTLWRMHTHTLARACGHTLTHTHTCTHAYSTFKHSSTLADSHTHAQKQTNPHGYAHTHSKRHNPLSYMHVFFAPHSPPPPPQPKFQSHTPT